jgi:hypothetical protein
MATGQSTLGCAWWTVVLTKMVGGYEIMQSGRMIDSPEFRERTMQMRVGDYKAMRGLCEAIVLMSVACRRSHSATSRLAEARAASINVVSS